MRWCAEFGVKALETERDSVLGLSGKGVCRRTNRVHEGEVWEWMKNT